MSAVALPLYQANANNYTIPAAQRVEGSKDSTMRFLRSQSGELQPISLREDVVRFTIVPVSYPTVAEQILSKWNGRYCRAFFREAVNADPRGLARIIKNAPMEPHELTFAAEIFGAASDSALVRSVLIPLAKGNLSPVVREGAIYGLQNHVDTEVVAILKDRLENDPSPGVRAAAEDALGRAC